MFGRIYAIALNTFREAIRKRFLYAIAILVLGVNLFAGVVGEMSQNEEVRVARDLGLFSISFFGSVAAIILGSVLLYNEIQRRTIHTILSKPIERHEFVLGKYLGMAMTLSVLVAMFAVTMLVVLSLRDMAVTAAVVKAIALSWMEVLVTAGIAVMFSSFSTPVLAGVFSFCLWFIGRITPAIQAAIETADAFPAARYVGNVALRIVPDLHLFAISGAGGEVAGNHVSVHGDFVGWDYVATAIGHGGLYLAAMLLLATIIFARRDFS